MHDVGLLIWIALIVIGIVSSVRKNARQARQIRDRQVGAQSQAMQAPPPVQVPPPVQSVPSFVVQRVMAPPVTAVSPAQAPQPARPPAPVPPPPIVAAPPAPAVTPARVGTSPIRGMFGGSATLVRAIVVSEVLGPPRALGEHTSWSPRHSEPSI
jgi:hypothetical protein